MDQHSTLDRPRLRRRIAETRARVVQIARLHGSIQRQRRRLRRLRESTAAELQRRRDLSRWFLGSGSGCSEPIELRAMSNSSYLTCMGARRKTRELYAEYTLPPGWAWLFAPDELHVGDPKTHPVVGALFATRDRETSSYLLCEATLGISRFVERMTHVGLAVTGSGMTARICTWLSKYMADGYWFADTSEFEWMDEPGNVLESMRRDLAVAASATRFLEPDASSLLLTFGWGTGLSDEEKKRAGEQKTARALEKQLEARETARRRAADVDAMRAAPVDVVTLEGRPYSIRGSFVVGEKVAHSVFRSGVVTAVTPTTITVEFPTGPQLLAHQRK